MIGQLAKNKNQIDMISETALKNFNNLSFDLKNVNTKMEILIKQ